ncbi:MDR family MFS transporter [Acidisphaera sp. L21]|uniref:MDR family MFS transporter n=1 Tax=Acidisphaera sp. L21 TaxID=1641851 RepID=UPI00131DF7F3|nr:MDR family MFS transporter [Acidisphaera sp. L21]
MSDAKTSSALVPTQAEFRWVLIGLMLALTLAALDQNIVATALPRITGDLGGLSHLSWVVTSFIVTSTISAPLYGKLSDLYGRKPAFVGSIAIFLVGSVLCGLAESMVGLIAFRAVQGLGAGGLIVLAQTVIGDLVSPRERGRYQGMFAAVFAACSVAGPLLGGFITQFASWRWIFYVNLPVGGAALACILLALRPRPPSIAPRLDWVGAALLTAGTGTLLLVLSWGGNAYAWASPQILGLTVVAIAAFVGLAFAERAARQPILPPDLFGNGVFVLGALTIALATMALFAAVVFLPLMFQLLMGANPAMAGLMIAPMMGGVIIASYTGGRLVSRTGRYKLFPVLGLAAATLSYATLAWAVRNDLNPPLIEAVLVVMGLGIGLVMPNLTTAIQNAVARSELGAATASAAFFRSLGGAVGAALGGAVLAAHLQGVEVGGSSLSGLSAIASLPDVQRSLVLGAYRAGLSAAFITGTIIAGLGFLTVLFLPERPLRGAGG